MKRIEVVAAVILKGGEVFATRRGYGSFKGWWEFPGGKIEEGECPRAALVREIREELDASVEVGELLETVEWDYPEFCSLLSDSICLKEHGAAMWLTKDTLRSVNWLPADEGVLMKIEELIS